MKADDSHPNRLVYRSSLVRPLLVLLAALVAAVVALAGLPSRALATPASDAFSDVDPGAWYVTEGWLDDAYSLGLMSGYKGTTNFGPEDPVTRAQVATILFRAANPGSDATTNPAHYGTSSPFSDVPAGQWYTAAVDWCAKNGIVTGYGDTGKFGPEDKVTREQIALMAARYAKQIIGIDTSNYMAGVCNYMADFGYTDSWALTGVEWCCYAGIITGANAGGGTYYLKPLDNATRAQIAKIMTVLTHFVPTILGPSTYSGTLYVINSADLPSMLGLSDKIATEFAGKSFAMLLVSPAQRFYVEDGGSTGYSVLSCEWMMVSTTIEPVHLDCDRKYVEIKAQGAFTYHDIMGALADAGIKGVISIEK